MVQLTFNPSKFHTPINSNIGFSSGTVKGFTLAYNKDGTKIGVYYCDGNSNDMDDMIFIPNSNITWHSKTEFSTKQTINGLTIIKNDVIQSDDLTA